MYAPCSRALSAALVVLTQYLSRVYLAELTISPSGVSNNFRLYIIFYLFIIDWLIDLVGSKWICQSINQSVNQLIINYYHHYTLIYILILDTDQMPLYNIHWSVCDCYYVPVIFNITSYIIHGYHISCTTVPLQQVTGIMIIWFVLLYIVITYSNTNKEKNYSDYTPVICITFIVNLQTL